MTAIETPVRPIWLDETTGKVHIIDQRKLPHELSIDELAGPDDVIAAIRDMLVRGAPLIGVTGAFGVYLAARDHAAGRLSGEDFVRTCLRIRAARPTAVNLAWAVERMEKVLEQVPEAAEKAALAKAEACKIADGEAADCRKIGEYGLPLIEAAARKKAGGTVNILTHCNAGWLACVEYGTATAPIYAAAERGIDLHVWVDETRPLNQGARLTAWELGQRGIRHTVITDNAGGHLMQHGRVDMVIVGADRVSRTGDVANKIGTYLKALAAGDNRVPFYVALPSSTFDWQIRDGMAEIPIEERHPDEVRFVSGLEGGSIKSVLVCPETSPAANFAFDVTPARLVTGFITERGICPAVPEAIAALFPEKEDPSRTRFHPRTPTACNDMEIGSD